MKIDRIRQLNTHWLATFNAGSRNELAKMIGHATSNRIDQIISGSTVCGTKNRKDIERALALEDGWLDQMHPSLWSQLPAGYYSDDEFVNDFVNTLSQKDLIDLAAWVTNRLRNFPKE